MMEVKSFIECPYCKKQDPSWIFMLADIRAKEETYPNSVIYRDRHLLDCGFCKGQFLVKDVTMYDTQVFNHPKKEGK